MSLGPIIEVNNLSVHQEDILILSDITFTLNKGEFVYLIGKTGSGKTSLLRTLYADLPLKNGTAEIAGFSLEKLQRKQAPLLRRKLGIVFQNFHLLIDRTVNDNLLYVMKATGWKDKLEMHKRLHEVLDKVELSTKGFKMPNQLSGGEQQRLVIARALINDPELILADEPTGNLDPETSEGIFNLLVDISKSGRAVVMATHNYELLKKYPARILKCDTGKIYDSLTSDFKLHETEI